MCKWKCHRSWLKAGKPSSPAAARSKRRRSALEAAAPAAAGRVLPGVFAAELQKSKSESRCDQSRSMTRAAAMKTETLPQPQAQWYPPGTPVSCAFGDGQWYDGIVLEAPWPAGHRWANWRLVHFDDGMYRRGRRRHSTPRPSLAQPHVWVRQSEAELTVSSHAWMSVVMTEPLLSRREAQC